MGCEKLSVELNSLNLNFLEPVDVVEVALCSMNSPILWSTAQVQSVVLSRYGNGPQVLHQQQSELTGTGTRPQCSYFSQGDRMTKAEQEIHIWKCSDETEYCVYCTDPAKLPHYLRLAEKVGGRVVQHQGG